ncbi:pilus assembly PilX family protein [Chitinimonas taiwanensis]|uniref:Type IV pilus assembly protein PilX n=1 Tax=Chitinimonas taiwanensis DSM 18899 TaxID=1121279 RepID=A0A1K2HLR2_9NEIS|nr:PilX N-terminal domain-containing pilus assembly protein [Chitinimonas taiwanensis]SFZ77194.1 type IV pilus assembly protein PilX [Chitinimonas taiwanensis DSM 18899]
MNTYSRRINSGFVLITSLVFLIVLTMIVVSSIRSATLYERAAGNTRNHSQAFQAAEFALRQAQFRLVADPPPVAAADDACNDGLCGKTFDTSIFATASNWLTDDNKGKSCGVNNADCNKGGAAKVAELPNVTEQPRYVIKKLVPGTDSNPTCDYFELTSMGVGSSADSAVILRSIVKSCAS